MRNDARAPQFDLTDPQRSELEATFRSHTAPCREVLRARIVLMAAGGVTTARIARDLGCDEEVVRKWRRRFAATRDIKHLRDQPRSGRPSRLTTCERFEVVRMACEPVPEELCRVQWTQASLVERLATELSITLSCSEVGRILRGHALHPHRVTQWVHSPDPDFAAKVARVVSLLLAPPGDGVVLSIDEKTGMQALGRRYAMRAAAPGRNRRQDFEYVRHGTTTLIAAYDVYAGTVYGECRSTRTGDDLVDYMETVAEIYDTGKVYVIWDNLNVHKNGAADRWTAFNARHGGRFEFVFTPLHASWVNPVEGWFSIFARRVLRGAEFQSVDDLIERTARFITRWNEVECKPLRWTFRGPCDSSNRRAA